MLSICDQNYKVFLHLGLSNCLNNLKDKTNLSRIIIISCIISIFFKTRPNRPRTDPWSNSIRTRFIHVIILVKIDENMLLAPALNK